MKRRIVVGAALLLLVLAGAAVALPPRLWGYGVDYSRVASIKSDARYQDKTLLERAWQLPVAARYRGGFDSQRNGSFCGPTTLEDVLRSLGVGIAQEQVLEGTGKRTYFGMLLGGITLDELAEVARKKTDRRVTVLRDLDLATFRQHLARANDPSRRYSVNFSRGPLFGSGGGHHSPIGGYLEGEDLVFVLDVNAKYGPWLAPAARLFEALDTVDRGAGKKRGLLLFE